MAAISAPNQAADAGHCRHEAKPGRALVENLSGEDGQRLLDREGKHRQKDVGGEQKTQRLVAEDVTKPIFYLGQEAAAGLMPGHAVFGQFDFEQGGAKEEAGTDDENPAEAERGDQKAGNGRGDDAAEIHLAHLQRNGVHQFLARYQLRH